MQKIEKSSVEGSITRRWRHAALLAIIAGSFILLFSQPPFAQDQSYHAFADRRGLFGIPNFGDVSSNVGFLVVGLFGLRFSLANSLGPLKSAWLVMFSGIALVGGASSYYHWMPNDSTLVWDRMTLTVGFMGLFVALVGEYVNERLRVLLVPAILIGVYSVVHWNWFQDLRFYYWIQLMPLLIIPTVVLLYRPSFSHQWLILTGAILYGFAKLAELGDSVVFKSTHDTISGHTIKHLVAALGCGAILLALYKRRPLQQ